MVGFLEFKFWNILSFSFIFITIFQEKFQYPNHRRPQKKKKRKQFTNFVTQCNPPVPSLYKILMNKWHLVENHPFRLLSKITKSDFSFPTRQKSFKDIQYPGEAGMSKPPVICIPGFHLYFLASLVPVALYSVSIWNQKCHFRKGTNFGNQTLTAKSEMNPAKNTPFFNQRKQDKNQNKYQMLAFPCVEQLCNRGK